MAQRSDAEMVPQGDSRDRLQVRVSIWFIAAIVNALFTLAFFIHGCP